MSQLDNEIKQLIEEITCSKYIGKLKVTKDNFNKEDNTAFWTLFLYLDLEYSPLILAYDGPFDKFKAFIANELKQRKLQYIRFWNTIQEQKSIDYYNE